MTSKNTETGTRRDFLKKTTGGIIGVSALSATNGKVNALPEYSINTDLRETTGVSGSQLDEAVKAYRPNSPLIGLGDTCVEVGKSEGINEVYIMAHAIHESAWGTSEIAQDKNNLFGWGAYDSDPYDGAKYFSSFEECVNHVMSRVRKWYLTPGGIYYNGPTLKGMNVKYATDTRWAEKIAKIMNMLGSKIDNPEGGEGELPREPAFGKGQRVATTVDLSVRSGAGLDYSRDAVASAGSAGYIRDGPIGSDGYVWWKVGYNNGYEGWSVQRYLENAPVSSKDFRIGEEVVSRADLNVRKSHGLEHESKGVAPRGMAGWVKNGYVTEDGYTWWEIEWDNGLRGWSVEKYLKDGSDVEFRYGERVRTTVNLNVRTGPSVYNSATGVAWNGTEGTVIDGYVTNDGYIWWAVDWDNGLQGWSVERYLD